VSSPALADTRRLEGNGAGLVRERALALRIQDALERVYGLERVAAVDEFVVEGGAGEREALLLREEDGALEMGLRLPQLEAEAELDTTCQIIEGVSHFVYLVERARVRRETTQLELELQAEVDKWVILGASISSFDARRSAQLRKRLYEAVSYAEAEGTETGDRYRVANDVANRFVRRLERWYVDGARFRELRAELRTFYRLGQEEKLRVGRAAA
jgi:hypothetical protein